MADYGILHDELGENVYRSRLLFKGGREDPTEVVSAAPDLTVRVPVDSNVGLVRRQVSFKIVLIVGIYSAPYRGSGGIFQGGRSMTFGGELTCASAEAAGGDGERKKRF